MSTGPDVTSLNMHGIRHRPGVRRVNPLRTAPNLLTLLRICIAPLLVLAVLERRFVPAFVLFLMAAFTDAMDGLLARWLQQRTRIGQYLDPIADKLLLSSLFLALTYMGILEPRIAVLVFGRDIGMLVTAMILYSVVRLRDFRPSLLGKANSFTQVLAVGSVLLSMVDQQPWIGAARDATLDAVIALTVLSGFHYAWVASQRIGELTYKNHAGDQPVPRKSGSIGTAQSGLTVSGTARR